VVVTPERRFFRLGAITSVVVIWAEVSSGIGLSGFSPC
jgi:hypothetical protein